MNSYPLGNRVLVKLSKNAAPKNTVIVLINSDDSYSTGTVMSIGTNVQPVGITVGDRVLVENGAGTEVTLQGETMVLVSPDDIVAVVE